MAEKSASGDNAIDRIPPHHPLFLPPSETQGATIIQHTLTGSDSYVVWSRPMQIALHGKHKIVFIDRSYTKESQDEKLHDQWEQCNVVILSWLLNSTALYGLTFERVLTQSQAHAFSPYTVRLAAFVKVTHPSLPTTQS